MRHKDCFQSVIFNKRSGKFFLFLFTFFAGLILQAQTSNNPNKVGPLGTQVNTFTGNLFLSREEIKIPARMIGFDLSFKYNSFNYEENVGYGRGWSFKYNIFYSTDTNNAKSITWGNGRSDQYEVIPGGFQSPIGHYGKLTQYEPGKYVLAHPDSTKYFFADSNHKRVTRIERPSGNYINFSYSGRLLQSMTTGTGHVISFSYNNAGLLSTLTDAMGSPVRTYTYNYDLNGNLLQVTDPLNGKWKYSYLVNGPMKTLTDKNSNTVNVIYFPDFTVSEVIGCNQRISFSYDSTSLTTIATDHMSAGNQVTTYKYKVQGNDYRVTSIKGNCCGYMTSFEYNDAGNRVSETDANGNIYRYTFDDRGNILSVTNPLNQVDRYTYTVAYNKISSFTDHKGNRYSLSYDAKGNVIQLLAPGNLIYTATYNAMGDIVSSTDPKGNHFAYSYDANGNPFHVSGPLGYNATFSVNMRGEIVSYTDSRGHSTSGTYDILGRVTQITSPYGNKEITYDAAGNPVSVKNRNGETALMDYDASGRLVKLRDAAGNAHIYGYNEQNKIVSSRNRINAQANFIYDNRNRLSIARDPEGNNYSFTYDANGNPTTAALANGSTRKFVYDKLNRLISISDQDGVLQTRQYDVNGNVTSYSNGEGATMTFTYDSLNRKKTKTDPLGNMVTFGYDKVGNLVSINDAKGLTNHYAYDSLNRTISFTNTNGFTVNALYDAIGNLIQVRDQNNNATNYAYDSANRVKRTTFADGSFEQNGYDPKGQLVSKRTTDGNTIFYQRDNRGRLISRILPDGQVISYTHDAAGRVVTATNNAGTVTLTYDALDRITSESFAGKTVNYSYNISGRTQTMTYPDGAQLRKDYDYRNRLVKISRNGIVLAEYMYDNLNRITSKNFGNGLSTLMQYDIINRVTSLNTSAIQQTTFSYDKVSNKSSINRLNRPAESESFIYDNGYRLVDYKKGPLSSPVSHTTYTYDQVGNRIGGTSNGVSTVFTKNNLNQVITSNNVNQNILYTYDARGNLTFDGTFYKNYDAENRLIKDSSSASSVITYKYDAFNRRVERIVNGAVTRYVFSAFDAIEERGNTGQLITRTVYNSFHSPLTNEKNGGTYYYHLNEMNSVEAITTEAGRLVERYQYDAYGALQRFDSLNNPLPSSIAGNRFGFTGQEFDSASGGYRFFFRNYSPATGTFSQRDLIGYADNMGLYQYVNNNPANGIDILGLECETTTSALDVKLKFTSNFNVQGDWSKNTAALYGADASFKLGAGNESNSSNGNGENNFGESFGKSMPGQDNGTGGFGDGNLTIDKNSTADWAKFGSGETSGADGSLKLGGSSETASGSNQLDTKLQFSNDHSLNGNWSKPASGEVYGKDASFKLGPTEGSGLGVPKLTFKSGSQESTDANFTDGKFSLNSKPTSGNPSGNVDGQLRFKGFETGDWTKTTKDAYGGDGTFKFSGETKMTQIQQLLVCENDGTRKKRPKKPSGPGTESSMRLVVPIDPNEIRGPVGEPGRAWVSVNARLPYTVLFENDTAATAPAKYVRVSTPIESKQDAATFELGSFGFNNQSFTIPPNTPSYYQRLDCRDSMGLFVDVTAGYDQVNNEAFWIFQSIDPLTLLPPEDPLVGLLFLQDTAQPMYGNGFVNFSIKPQSSSQTLDTIGAKAFIVFDNNEVIPTNIHSNTIDAVAPTSNIIPLDDDSPDTVVPIHFTGTDDVNGSGLKSYSLYVSDDNGPLQLVFAGFTGHDTTFKGTPGHQYRFYVSAVDTAGNIEALRVVDSTRITNGEQVICPGGDVTLAARVPGSTYQWQVDNGSGYVAVTNSALYSGSTAATLSINDAPTTIYGYRYRCVIDGARMSEEYIVKFGMTWEGTGNDAWEDPSNWSCGTLPDERTDVTINAGKLNYPKVNSNVMIRSLSMKPGATGTVMTGYRLTILR